MNNLELNISGLQCDNKDCDFIDPTIKVEDYEENINKKCPKCGEVLLTQEDYNTVLKMINTVSNINKLDLSHLQLGPRIEQSFALDGTGNLSLKR